MEVKVFTSSLIRDTMPESELANLVSEFREYKKQGMPHYSLAEMLHIIVQMQFLRQKCIIFI